MLALHEAPRSALSEAPDPTPDGAPGMATDPAIVCAGCLGVITASRHRMAINGAHEHRFMNPGGYLFHLGCFAEAVGCAVVGPDSNEYPWFPGFAWRIAQCGHCRVQLGWQFRGPASAAFFGLVLDRLRHAGAGG
jgi:hypothetical protein